jgi:hypothetical protein
MWTQPEIRTYNEEELLESMEVKAQYHEDSFPHEDAAL